ncbi:MAG: hypothetical protein HQ521_00705 [Bacteroidetes bacterium]|nr:hypothetical protein [Bacteroidota bacterium]
MRNIFIIFIFSFISQSTYGDEYIKAYTKQYKSQNGIYTLTVYPTYTPKNFDREMNKRNKNPEKHKNRLIKDTIIPCHAILTRTINYEQEIIWEKDLVNKTAPEEAIVTNDGEYVLTFDDWFYIGKGENVIVVYDKKGDKLQNYRLNEFCPFPINDLTETVSSIPWYFGIETYSISPNVIEILVINKSKEIRKTKYNLTELKFE